MKLPPLLLLLFAAIVAIAAGAVGAAGAMTGGSVEAKFRGTWVPAALSCISPLKARFPFGTAALKRCA